MSIPSSQELQYGLVRLLRAQPNQGCMYEVYSSLASEYPAGHAKRNADSITATVAVSSANEVNGAVHRLRKASFTTVLIPVGVIGNFRERRRPMASQTHRPEALFRTRNF